MKKKPQKNKPQQPRKQAPTPKKKAPKPIDKKWIIAGAAALVAVVILTAGLIRFYGDTPVARVNGIRITESDVAFALANDNDLLQVTAQMDMFGISEDVVREEAVRQAAFAKLFEDYARRNNIPLTGNENPNVIMSVVSNAIVADQALFAAFEPYLPEDEFPAAERRAQEILDRALAGEDFDFLVAVYSDDGMPPEGYTFVEGTMVTEFFEATRDLEIGEISGLVRTQFGFHIIKRVDPPNPDNVMRPPGQGPPGPGEEEELFGVKHILIRASEQTPEQRMAAAVRTGFETKLTGADIEFLRGLSTVQVQP